ncbi:hypothetical protein [Marivita sp.]|uniref:hypothetical protein n=1 Tax=Marivita sp. TaxID=2003365 RepID=UPI0025B8BD60|nr:hypothetical protein [Marivita sp.]
MILIADSGGTNTMWALIDKHNVEYVKSAGMHPSQLGYGMIFPPALERHRNYITELYFYGTGCARQQGREKVKQFLANWFSNAHITVFSDLMALAHAGWGDEAGNVAILGTGSSMAYYDGFKLNFEVWSPGKEKDPGSGTDLALQILKLYEDAALSDDISGDLQKFLNKKLEQEDENGLLARYIMQNQHNVVLSELCVKQFSSFFEFYALLLQKYPFPIVFGGSIAYLSSRLLNNVAKKHNLKIHSIIREPIYPLVELYLNRKV